MQGIGWMQTDGFGWQVGNSIHWKHCQTRHHKFCKQCDNSRETHLHVVSSQVLWFWSLNHCPNHAFHADTCPGCTAANHSFCRTTCGKSQFQSHFFGGWETRLVLVSHHPPNTCSAGPWVFTCSVPFTLWLLLASILSLVFCCKWIKSIGVHPKFAFPGVSVMVIFAFGTLAFLACVEHDSFLACVQWQVFWKPEQCKYGSDMY